MIGIRDRRSERHTSLPVGGPAFFQDHVEGGVNGVWTVAWVNCRAVTKSVPTRAICKPIREWNRVPNPPTLTLGS